MKRIEVIMLSGRVYCIDVARDEYGSMYEVSQDSLHETYATLWEALNAIQFYDATEETKE